MMDIKKEREAFEAIAENIRLLRGAKFKDGEYVALSSFDESSKELAAQLNYGWAMWLSAKAQAIPDGFEIGRLQDRIVELLDERQELYAQLDAGCTEGFVLVPKEPTQKMIDAGYESSYDAKGFEIPLIYKAMIEAAQEQGHD